MKRKVSDIILNGKYYNSNELIGFANEKIQSSNTLPWEKTIFQFILDWISDSPTIMVKTSGSTGNPKTILLEKEKMIQSALRTGAFFQLKKNDTALLCIPVDFIAGKMMLVRAFVLGLNLIPIEPKGNPLEVIDENFHFAAMTPMQVSKTLDDFNGVEKLDRIQNLIVGGGEVSQDLAPKITTFKNNTWHTYGMTETITHVALKKLNGAKQAYYFEALADITFEKDERDCLIIRASHLSEKPIVTNDIVNLISNTRFEFLGRYDNIINTGGVKVSPEKIENMLRPYFEERIVICGYPDEVLGQKLVLVIEDQKKEQFDLNEISNKAQLSKFETPKSVFYMNKFSETENGKINRRMLVEKLLK